MKFPKLFNNVNFTQEVPSRNLPGKFRTKDREVPQKNSTLKKELPARSARPGETLRGIKTSPNFPKTTPLKDLNPESFEPRQGILQPWNPGSLEPCSSLLLWNLGILQYLYLTTRETHDTPQFGNILELGPLNLWSIVTVEPRWNQC